MNKFRYIILSKKVCLCVIFAVASLVIGTFSAISHEKTLATAVSSKKLPIYCVDSSEKLISLSFDAAWGNEDTKQLIEIFKKYNIAVTFFVVGDWVDKYPESVKQLDQAGHEIMNHSDTHAHMPQLSIEKMQREISDCNDKIEKITKKRPILFRPPYGDYDNKLIDTVSALNMYCVQWDVEILDNSIMFSI